MVRPSSYSTVSADGALLNQAVALHQAGRLDEAARLYQQFLDKVPGHFDATHLLGVVALQRGDLATAETLITQALKVKPKDAGALNNLGTVLLRGQRLEEAREQFERATKALPTSADAQSNLGSVLRQLDRVAESVVPLKRAYGANPKSAAVADLLGASLIDTGDSRGAVTVFETSVKSRPQDAQAWLHLAIASNLAGQPKRALEAADKSLALAPDAAPALSARGRALAGLGDLAGARDAFEAGVRAAPASALSHHNLGVFLRQQGDAEAAVKCLRDALRLDPALMPAREALVNALVEGGRVADALRESESAEASQPASATTHAMRATAQFANDEVEAAVESYRQAVASPGADSAMFLSYGDALFAAGHAVEATRQYQRAVDLDASSVRARLAVAMSHLRPIYDDTAQMEASRRMFTRSLAELDTWLTPARAVAGAGALGSAKPFYLAYHPVDAKPLLQPFGITAARVMATGVAAPPAAPANATGARKLRVGIASAQVHEHSVWNAITEGWVRHLDRKLVDLTLFKLARRSDDATAMARREATVVEAPTTLDSWVRAIAEARLDVLIFPEIGMDPMTTRLAAMRLAPVQAAAWGQPLTTGLPTIDLYLSAQAFEPAGGAAHYSERLVALPNLGVHTRPLQPQVVTPDFAALHLPADQPLLLCPGTPFKYTPQGDAALAAIAERLQARGSGRLVFFRSHRPAMSAQVEQRMRKSFAQAGVDYDRTIAWVPTLDRGRFFGLMQRSTAMLDTIGFSGFNTALQALEAGLPVVAYEGEFMRGRLASGPLRHLGLDELVATSAGQYADIAMRLVEDADWHAHLEREIAQRRHALFFDQAPVRALEDALFDAAGVAKPA